MKSVRHGFTCCSENRRNRVLNIITEIEIEPTEDKEAVLAVREKFKDTMDAESESIFDGTKEFLEKLGIKLITL